MTRSFHPTTNFRRLLLAVSGCLALASVSLGDQIIVGGDPGQAVLVADNVECSTCDALPATSVEFLADQAGGEFTAGQLWQFFKNQGVDSMDELSLRLDVDPNQATGSAQGPTIDISSLEFQIENPTGVQGLATDVKFADKQLLIPYDSSNADRANMQLAVKLQYDFMERFSADSQEKIKLNVAGSGLLPSISIASKAESFGEVSLPVLAAFSGFWLAVFIVVNWLTKPEPALTQESGVARSKNRTVPA